VQPAAAFRRQKIWGKKMTIHNALLNRKYLKTFAARDEKAAHGMNSGRLETCPTRRILVALTQRRPKPDPILTQTPLYLHIGSTVPVFTQSFYHKNLTAFFSRFSRAEGRAHPATFRIPQVATRPADAVNLKSKNAVVRSAPDVQKVQLFGST
jgi:hypothetical protein